MKQSQMKMVNFMNVCLQNGIDMMKKELVKLPPYCTWCEKFRYKKEAEKNLQMQDKLRMFK